MPRRGAGRVRPGAVRIIGGQWRGRKLPVVDVEALRPTPDRVRETLFNWLMPVLPGARCVDLFAGTGVLGFEALSRGAALAVLVERDAAALDALGAARARLGASGARIVAADARAWLSGTVPDAPFDLAFLDPPYHEAVLGECCRLLGAGGWLKAGAFVYVETASDERPPWPAAWRVHRALRAGHVNATMLRVTAVVES
jgi:16S rRNA (guanine966-N2)-methyltransferase